MTLMVLRNISQVFCEMSILGFVWRFSQDQTEKGYTLAIGLAVVGVDLDHLAEVVLLRFPSCKRAPIPLPHCALWKEATRHRTT